MLSAIQISKKFKDRIILNETSCEFEKGKSYAIIGQSGAGKTTFLNILGGLEQPDSGKICISGKEVSEKNIDKLRRDILGYIFQNFGLIDNDSVKSNLSVGIKHKKIQESQKIKLMHEVLEQLDLKYLDLERKVYTLSGGEQQRIALARIILKQPQIIFADEPTGSLDPDNASLILKHLLADFSKQAIILIATHDPKVWNACDYVVKLNNQTIQFVKN